MKSQNGDHERTRHSHWNFGFALVTRVKNIFFPGKESASVEGGRDSQKSYKNVMLWQISNGNIRVIFLPFGFELLYLSITLSTASSLSLFLSDYDFEFPIR